SEAATHDSPPRRIAVVLARDLDLGPKLSGLKTLLGFTCVRVHVLSALGVEPDVHRAVVDYLQLVEVKLRVPGEVVADDFFEVIVVNLNLVFDKSLITVELHGKDI